MQNSTPRSIRPFIGAKDYRESLRFYAAFGFTVIPVGDKLTYCRLGDTGFYLQDAYVEDWVDNSMLFLEVEDARATLLEIKAKALPSNFPGVRVSEVVVNDWGMEFFVHDPSGILWHIGTFKGVG